MGPEVLFIGVSMIFMFTVIVVLNASCYQKCPPNQAMIISGMMAGENGLPFKIIVGGGTLMLPLIQQKNLVSLEIMTIQVRAKEPMITHNGIPITVEGIAQVKVRGDDVSIMTAAEMFLGKSPEEIAKIAQDTIIGHLRATLGTVMVEEFIRSLAPFAQLVKEVSIADLAKMGLTVVSFTITEIKDNSGYLEARSQTTEATQSTT